MLLLNGRWSAGREQIYICANDLIDACKICEQVSGSPVGWRRELNTYFSRTWGDLMKDIVQERGAWVVKNPGDPNCKPEKVL